MKSFLLVAAFTAAFVASSVRAQEPSSDVAARSHFESGRAYFDRARYDDAVREFEEAYRLSNRHQLLLNIARSYEAAGEVERAVESLERWQTLADVADPMRDEVAARLSRLRLQAEARREARESGAPPPPASTDPVEPVEPSTAETQAADANGTTSAAERRRSPAGFVVIGAGAAMAGVGAAFVALGYRDVRTVENPAAGSTWSSSADEYDRAPTRLGVGYALAGVGAAACVTGIILRVTSGHDDDAPVAVDVGPTGVVVRGSF